MSVRQGANLIASGNVAVDGDTVSFNGNASLQANGVINKNTEIGATNPIYDWVGTLAEYTAQSVATNHPDWVCFITDDYSSDYGLFANIDASNFTNTGKTYLSGLGMPDFMRAEEITILAVGAEYTAPANGWFVCTAMSGYDGLGTIQIASSTNSTLPNMRVASWATGAANRSCGVIFPAKTDDTIRMYYNNSLTDKCFYFIYADGDKTNS